MQIVNVTDIEDKYEIVGQYLQRGINQIKHAEEYYTIPRWLRQPHYVEVWVEKDAMRGILDSIINTTGEREVRIVPSGGQESVTYAWNNSKRLKKQQDLGKKIHIRYFGDLDPSGESIERSIYEKIYLPPYGVKNVDFKRVGVTKQQKLQFNLIANTDPETMNKLKRNTARFAFMEKYGLESEDDLFQIEVDALQAIAPEQFKNMVIECVDEFFDEEIYEHVQNDRPTELQINQIATTQVQDLLVSLQNRLDGPEDTKP